MASRTDSSRRIQILAIFAIAALAAAGGLYYVLGVYLPKEKRGAAQAEIERWEGRLAEARACLLGPSPGSAVTREAIAMRELAPDPWNRTTCTQLIGKLSRGEAEDTGELAVEEAWHGLDRAAGKVAAAFLAHVDPYGEPAKNRRPDALPLAIDGLDAAHAALRAAAELPPPPGRAAGKPLPAAELLPLRDGAEPIRSLESWTMPTMNRVIAFGKTASHEAQLVLTPGAAPVARRIGAGALRTVPDAAWGAAARITLQGKEIHQIVVGPLDDRGEPPALDPIDTEVGAAPTGIDPERPGRPPTPRKDVIAMDDRATVFAVVGSADDGLVVAGTRRALVLIRAQAGKLAADKPIEIEQLAFATDPAGRALIAYNDADGLLRAIVARGAAQTAPFTLGEAHAGGACMTAQRGWIAGAASEQIVAFDLATGAAAPQAYEQHDLLGCTAAAALLHQRDATHYVVCTADCRVAVLDGMRPSKIATLAGDRVVAAVVRDQVMGVWREKGPPAYYALGKQLTPQFALSDGKVIDVIAEAADGLVIVRVPAP